MKFNLKKENLIKIIPIGLGVVVLIGIIIAVVLVLTLSNNNNSDQSNVIANATKGYKCENNGRCQKIKSNLNGTGEIVSLDVCRILCGSEVGTLWPKPTGKIQFDKKLELINVEKIYFKNVGAQPDESFWREAIMRIMSQILAKIPRGTAIKNIGNPVEVEVNLASGSRDLSMATPENYELFITSRDSDVLVKINADNYFGARHAFETFSQLIVFDDLNVDVKIAEIHISDAPKFKHRGISLDTSRSFYTVGSIKRAIDAMAMVKMNVFHWHITDSQSFPIFIRSQPELTEYGAYSRSKVYTPDDIADIVRYAVYRGIRVIPELDSPAHVGEGWQFKENLTTCFNFQPWTSYCGEPPCGQLDPSNDEVYEILGKIFIEFRNEFLTADLLHMGGDEVYIQCWNSSERLKNWMKNKKGWNLDKEDFMNLWGYFQEKALERVDKAFTKFKIPIVLWTSSLTEEPYLTKFLDKNRYIIQIWTNGDDSRVQTILEKGYKVIFSNVDALYLDCGFSSWVSEGPNSCAPYKGWQKVYDNDISKFGGKYSSQILGAETALWSEQADSQTIDSRLWPRVSALAERLWSDPQISWKDAEPRMQMHHKALLENGIKAERLQPQWCLQNEGECF